MAAFNQTKWYTIGFQGNSNLLLDAMRNPLNNDDVGKPQWGNSIQSLPQQLWQLWPVDNTGFFLIRCAGAGSDMFLSGWGTYDAKSKAAGAPVLVNPERYPDDQGILWNISSWEGDNTGYSMSNKANGTTVRLGATTDGNYGALLQDTTTADEQVQLTLAPQGPADWYGFQTMITPAVAKAVATATTTRSAGPTPADATASATAGSSNCPGVASSSISPGASAGIAVGVTVVVCAGIFAIAWILMSRSLRRKLQPNHGIAINGTYGNGGLYKELESSASHGSPQFRELSGASTRRPKVQELPTDL